MAVRTRRNLEADSRGSRVKRVNGWSGMLPRKLGNFETALGERNDVVEGLDPRICGREAGVKGWIPLELSLCTSVRIPPPPSQTSLGYRDRFPAVSV
jgi:hypothetical protein